MMNGNRQFSAIRERFEVGLQENQNFTYQRSTVSSVPSKPFGTVNRFPAGVKNKNELSSCNESFPKRQQQRLVIKKEYQHQRLEENGNDIQATTTVRSVQQLPIVQTQAEPFPMEGKSFTELIRDKASTIRRKPAVADKPKSKHIGLQDSNRLSANIGPSVQYSDSTNSEHKSTKNSPQPKQMTSSVINLRQQFEQILFQQHVNSKSQQLEVNKNTLRPTPLVSIKTKLSEACAEMDRYRLDIREYRANDKSCETFQNPPRWKFVANEQEMNLKTPQFESSSLPRPGKQTQMKFIASTPGTPAEYNDFSNSLEQCTPKVEASNLHIITSFNDDEVSTDDEFEEDEEEPDEQIYANVDHIYSSVYNDLPKLPTKIPRQRTSYAEPRSRPELKPSMSFNQSDIKKNVDDKQEANEKLENILRELIKTENDYVKNLLKGIRNYENMFTRKDRPRGLIGKEFYLFGNIKQIAMFHRDTFLPMLIRNQNNLAGLFDEFLFHIDNHHMYEYVLYTMNKRRSLEICTNFAPYFTYLQRELGEQLGIYDFLLQPIQRLPRYRMLFQNLLSPLFKMHDKVAIASCCRVEKKIGALLDTVNEADLICDLVKRGDVNLNIYNSSNKFRKALDLVVYDSDRSICYATKVFVFDKCMIYTEIRGQDLIFRGCYDASKAINLTLLRHSFSLSYLHPKSQECIFHGEPQHIQCCLEFIDDMIQSNRRQASNEVDHNQLAAPYRQSNDSGLGNIWTLPEENESE